MDTAAALRPTSALPAVVAPASPSSCSQPSSSSSPGAELREIIVEFLDHSNEEKYDRLVADDKIKHPFKRRLSANSNESRPNSPPQLKLQQQVIVKPEPGVVMPNQAGTASTSTKRTRNVPKKTRYEHQSHSSLSSSSTSSSSTTLTSAIGGGGGVEAQRNANGKRYNESRQRRQSNAERETCEEVLSRRQKQIDYGKNTIGYDRYVQKVPRSQRTVDQPWTPPKHNKYSRRGWDGLVKVWRKKLHSWDPEGAKAAAADDDDSEDGVKPLDELAGEGPAAVKVEPKVEPEESSDDDAILDSDDCFNPLADSDDD